METGDGDIPLFTKTAASFSGRPPWEGMAVIAYGAVNTSRRANFLTGVPGVKV